MSFKRKFFLLVAIAATLSVTNSCSKEDSFGQEQIPGEQLPDSKNPQTSFKFLTINHASSQSDPGSISHISHGGISTEDIYKPVNGSEIPDRINEITLLGNQLCLTGCGLNTAWYMGSFVQLIDSASFKITKHIDLSHDFTKQEMSLSSSVKINDDLIFAAGSTSNDPMVHNIAIISLSQEKATNSFHTDFSVSKVIRVKNKLFLAGTAYNLKDSKIAVMDIDDIRPENIRIINDKTSLFNAYSSMLIDNQGKIWTLVNENNRGYIHCIDPDSEKIIKTIPLPYTISPLSSVSIAINAKASAIYLRAGRAFYLIDTETCQEPEDIVFEVTSEIVNGGMACYDLKIDHTGKLLFINHITGKGKKSEVYELDPEKWEVTNIYPTNTNSRYIYIAQ
ncbi:MAG: hypothetical protein ACRCSQ_05685 [Bacteroidales bacterium]